MELSIDDYLRHIVDEADFLLSSSKGLTLEQYLSDPLLTRAFVRSIEIIGEAVKSFRRISDRKFRISNGG